MLMCVGYGKEKMELTHFCIFFTLDPKAIYKSIDSGRIKNMNENANNMQSLGILLHSKQLRGLGGRFGSLTSPPLFLCGLGSKHRL